MMRLTQTIFQNILIKEVIPHVKQLLPLFLLILLNTFDLILTFV